MAIVKHEAQKVLEEIEYEPFFQEREREQESLQTDLYVIYRTDAFQWLGDAPPCSIHAVVTDPPYGLLEYSEKELHRLRNGNHGGVWRIPPSFDGCRRAPLPRFTVLTASDKAQLRFFFGRLAPLLMRVLVPGGHVMVATNLLVSHLVYGPFLDAGFEKRGEIIRVVQTLRGGDRPKNAHKEFSEVTVMPRSCWEPWGLFRKPCEGRVQDNLRKWGTGGLRRVSGQEPFKDLIQSSPTRPEERGIAPHPSLKPQKFLRRLARASLPLARGIILDPFMGSGSTIAAAAACGLQSVGLEIDRQYFNMAREAIPNLAAWKVDENGQDWKYEGSTASSLGGGRTHTFGLMNPCSRLRDCAVYCRGDIKLSGGKPTPCNGK